MIIYRTCLCPVKGYREVLCPQVCTAEVITGGTAHMSALQKVIMGGPHDNLQDMSVSCKRLP